ATSNPLWASVYRLLPALFGASATATSTAALSLTLGSVAGSESARRGLEKVGLVAGGAELLLSHAMERKWQHDQLPAPSEEKSVASMYKLSKALGVVAPLAIHAATQLSGRRSRSLSMLAAVATLAGGYLLRSALLSAGNAAAEHPGDYFRFTQP
ncbi:MAG TPA: hypothetical protein VE131_13415, partial [Terriglobales bacterium]|nr:hypothetical protein [Terriglobales bacterium]